MEFNLFGILKVYIVDVGIGRMISILVALGVTYLVCMWLFYAWKNIKKQLIEGSLNANYIFGVVCAVVIEVSSMNYLFLEYLNGKPEAAATLTAAVITFISVLGAAAGYFYSKREDKIQSIHAEGAWRRRMFDLEAKVTYDLGDLIELASLISIVPTEDKILAKYTNKIIKKILSRYANIGERLDVYLEDEGKLRSNVAIILKEETVFDYDITDKEDIKLNHAESSAIRRCIHAFLKDDWENVTN